MRGKAGRGSREKARRWETEETGDGKGKGQRGEVDRGLPLNTSPPYPFLSPSHLLTDSSTCPPTAAPNLAEPLSPPTDQLFHPSLPSSPPHHPPSNHSHPSPVYLPQLHYLKLQAHWTLLTH